MRNILPLLLTLCCSVHSYYIQAQSENDCNLEAFSHMEGKWFGVQYIYSEGDTTYVGSTQLTIKKALGDCALQEDIVVHGTNAELIFKAIGIRSYDKTSQSWKFTEVDNTSRHLTFNGREENNEWGFYLERERDGTKYLLRLRYPSINRDHFQQIFERSYDNGKSWQQSSHIDFKRSLF